MNTETTTTPNVALPIPVALMERKAALSFYLEGNRLVEFTIAFDRKISYRANEFTFTGPVVDSCGEARGHHSFTLRSSGDALWATLEDEFGNKYLVSSFRLSFDLLNPAS